MPLPFSFVWHFVLFFFFFVFSFFPLGFAAQVHSYTNHLIGALDKDQNKHKTKTDLGFPVVRLHDTYSHSFQRPFGHAINKQVDK